MRVARLRFSPGARGRVSPGRHLCPLSIRGSRGGVCRLVVIGALAVVSPGHIFWFWPACSAAAGAGRGDHGVDSRSPAATWEGDRGALADDPEMWWKARAARAAQVPESWRVPLAGQEEMDVLDYHLRVTVCPDSESIAGAVTTRLSSLVPALTQVVLDFWREMEVTGVEGPFGSLAYAHEGDALRIELERPYGVGEEAEVTVSYGGSPMSGGFGSFVFERHGEGSGVPVVATMSEPYYARTWWPCKDVPADKATATIEITVPESLTAVSPGTLLEVLTPGDGTRTYRWRESYPVATYLVSLAATDYATFGEIYTPAEGPAFPLTHYVYPEDLAAAQEDFSVLPSLLDLEIALFGAYPFAAEKYGMAQVPQYAAMEHQTLTSYGDYLITGDHAYDRVVAHELAHQWFGDLVTPVDWRHIWLNEGFGRYAEALWVEDTQGRQAYHDYLEWLDSGNFTGTIYDPAELFGATVYDKGAWVLHMLRHVLGDEIFFAALRDYLLAHAYGNVAIADFQAACEAAAGSDLAWFFDAWIYQRYEPSYRYWWVNREESGNSVFQLHLEQVQLGTGLFPMPLDLAVTTARGDTMLALWNDAWSEDYIWVLPTPVTAVALDPDGWVLKDVEEVTAPAVVPDARPAGPGPVLWLADPLPNPSAGEVELRFVLEGSGPVEIAVYDLRGRRVSEVYRGAPGRGAHGVTWNGLDPQGRALAPGLYFCRAQTRGASMTRSLVRVR